MAGHQNSRGGNLSSSFSASGQSPFFNQSLSGGLTVDSLSGPLLFTPVPLTASSEPPQQEHVAGKKLYNLGLFLGPSKSSLF